jgi:outer membrane biosynthesis protein TonB
MYITDEGERSLGAFILVSLIFHALVIFLYPQWEIAAGPGAFLMGNGGILTIVPIEMEQPSPRAQLSRQPGQGVPTTEKKVPVPEPKPEQEVKLDVKPEPAKQPVPKQETPPTPPEPSSTAPVQKEVTPDLKPPEEETVKPVTGIEKDLAESGTDTDTLLTSEHGQGVVVSGGGAKETEGGESQSPSAEQGPAEKAEPSPPPLPPLPAASSVVAGGGRVQYPKNAINEGLAGVVKLDAYVPKGAIKADRIVIKESSGSQNLDQVARLTVQNGWKMEPLLEDYVLSVTIEFSGPPGFEVTILYDGIRYIRGD